MRTASRLIFYALLLLFLANQAIENSTLFHPAFMRNYLDDLVCMPVSLYAFRLFLAAAYGRMRSLQLHYTLLAFAAFSFHFEGFLPRLSASYTADAWDIAAYAAGGIFFLAFMNGDRLPLPKAFFRKRISRKDVLAHQQP